MFIFCKYSMVELEAFNFENYDVFSLKKIQHQAKYTQLYPLQLGLNIHVSLYQTFR